MSANVSQVEPENVGKVLGKWLRGVNEKGRVFPKNKKVEIVFVVEAVNAILPRTEGVEDITLFKLPGTEYEVPTILPEKLQAVSRRRMLAYLRNHASSNSESLKSIFEQLSNLFVFTSKNKKVVVRFAKAVKYKDNPAEWNCFIQPPGGDVTKATDVGMDGFCPACALFGTVITNVNLEFSDEKANKNLFGESVGVKSRVEFDPAFAISDRSVSVADLTHNKVSDGVSWTGQSLFTEYHVVPGTVFVGKVTLEDVTEPELKAFLAVLSTIDRLGGRERVFGGVRVHIVGVKGGHYETVSALELARELAKKYGDSLPPVEQVVKDLEEMLEGKGFTSVDTEKFKKLVGESKLWDELWESTLEYDRQVVERILLIVKGEGKFEKG
jgi:CRISPR type I-D-associated protein Csc2